MTSRLVFAKLSTAHIGDTCTQQHEDTRTGPQTQSEPACQHTFKQETHSDAPTRARSHARANNHTVHRHARTRPARI